MNFKEGQKVTVIANVVGHKFELGEVVEIIVAYKHPPAFVWNYKCSNGITFWFLIDEEIELTKLN